MNNDNARQGEFEHSFALIDSDGRLVDWDSGFVREWVAAAPLISVGARYADLLRAATESHEARQFLLLNSKGSDFEEVIEARIKGLGTERSHEYRTPAGKVIRVDEYPTATGGVQRTARDITEEKRAASTLAEARQRLKAADSEAAGTFIEIRRNPGGRFLFPPVSEGIRRLLGLSEEFLGLDAMEAHVRMSGTEAESARLRSTLEHAARTLEPCSFEYSVRHAGGKLRWVRQSMAPRLEPDGTIVFAGMMRDITREKEAEDQIALLRSIVVRSSDSIIVFESDRLPDRDARIIYVNPKFMELFGGSFETLIGHPAGVLQPDRRSRGSAALLVAALARGDRAPIEFEALGRDDRTLWVEARVEILQKFDNGTFRWVVITRDITERRRAQAELLRAKEEAEAGNRAKGHFLANMSHELRTPLNAIIGFSELIVQGVDRNGWMEAYSEYLTDICQSGKHLLDLINTVLDLSKIEAGSLKLDLGPVDIDELIQTSVALVSGMAREGGVDLSVERDSEFFEISGDFLKLKQVLLNLLSNAIKFTPADGKVAIGAHGEANDVVITVADTGCGISEIDLERVILPFVQAENSLSRRYPGTGLGLSIAKQFCKLHGGRLDLESVEGQGTTVRIRLPRR